MGRATWLTGRGLSRWSMMCASENSPNCQGIGDFTSWTANSNVEIIKGDFNGDGYTDLALVNKENHDHGWTSIPIAFRGDSSWHVTSHGIGDFAMWAGNTHVK